MILTKYFPVRADGFFFASILDLIRSPVPLGRSAPHGTYWWHTCDVSFLGAPVPIPIRVLGRQVFAGQPGCCKQFEFPDPESALLWASSTAAKWVQCSGRSSWQDFLGSQNSPAVAPTLVQIEWRTPSNALAGVWRLTSKADLETFLPASADVILEAWRSLAATQPFQVRNGATTIHLYPLSIEGLDEL
jgi:hypothetical protein